jgi:mersacidin/lichenicidin family type 2 lantibiotic
MSHRKTIRAWKDEEYRLNLSDAERADLPAHPSGMIEVTDADLGVVGGGFWYTGFCTWYIGCTSVICPTLFGCW